jgi:hypothetical protein
MDGHGKGFLSKPSPHRIDVVASLDEERADRMAQPVEG